MLLRVEGPFTHKPLLASYELVTTMYCMWMSYEGLLMCRATLFTDSFDNDAAVTRLYDPREEAT